MKKIIILTIIQLLISSSCRFGLSKRNHIVFEDPIDKVEKALIEMKKLVMLLPQSKTVFSTGYSLVNKYLEINGLDLGNIDSIKLDTTRTLSNFSSSKKTEFVALAKYLIKNYITECRFDRDSKLWLYEYRQIGGEEYDDTRLIGILHEQEIQMTLSTLKILDRKGVLFLLANVNARIH